VEEGALADLILVNGNGNPLENLDLVAEPDQNFRVIMKNGTLYKNTFAVDQPQLYCQLITGEVRA
jgi:imidazolonepropionase-like amidohydrolase